MKKNPEDLKLVTIKIRKRTLKRLKIMAAENDMSMISLLDILIQPENSALKKIF